MYTLQNRKMITNNEKNILRFLLSNFNSDYSINEIAKKCNLAPNGAYTILKKFEEKDIILSKKIANSKSYKINFNNSEAIKLLELILMPDYKESKIKHRYNDLQPLKQITKFCILFGSYVNKTKPNDIDILCTIKKSDYKQYSRILEKIKLISPLPIHDIIQTKEDLFQNIKKSEPILLQAISEGVILWGQEFLIEVIKNVATR